MSVRDGADMTGTIWKTGFEIELLAPRGKTRADLAHALAEKHGGSVNRMFYPQSEPSLAPGVQVFENLILGFDAVDESGNRVALCVDDLTINADLNRGAPPQDGWMRIVSDDGRLLSLVSKVCDPVASIEDVLKPVSSLFGTPLESEGGIFKASDEKKRPIALATGLPGERERPCEIITAPLEDNRAEILGELLGTAKALGFVIPKEAAVHVHFDAERLCDARVLSRLIYCLAKHGKALRAHVGTNPNCVRLGPIATNLIELASDEAFLNAGWDEARQMLLACKPTKYCDFNFLNIAAGFEAKHTFEVRIFPGSIDADEVCGFANLFERILNWAVDQDRPACPDTIESFL